MELSSAMVPWEKGMRMAMLDIKERYLAMIEGWER